MRELYTASKNFSLRKFDTSVGAPARKEPVNQITDVLRDSKRLRLIATALELLHFERDDSAVIPIPGTDPQRYVTIGTAATVAQLLEIAPAAAAEQDWKASAECLLEEVRCYREIFKAAAMGVATMVSASELDLVDLDNTVKEALRDLSHVEIHLEQSKAPTTIQNRAVDVRLCIKELRAALTASAALACTPLPAQEVTQQATPVEAGSAPGVQPDPKVGMDVPCRNCLGFGWEPSVHDGRRPCGFCAPSSTEGAQAAPGEAQPFVECRQYPESGLE